MPISKTAIIREIALALSFAFVITTVLVGFTALGVLNVPAHYWSGGSLTDFVAALAMILAPLFALARVIERWWQNLLRRYSKIWRQEDTT